LKKAKKLLINYLPPVLWAAIIFIFSSFEQTKVSDFFFWDFIAKKGAHFFEYAILFFLISRASGKNYALSFILTILYSLSDEFHQSFVPGRTAAIYDVAIDFAGAATSAYIIWKLKLQKPPKQKK